MRKRNRVREEQLSLDWKTWGGPRSGAGRKRTTRSRVPHRRRQRLSGREPVHVTSKLMAGLPSLRSRKTAAVVWRKLHTLREREDFRIVHFSIQRDHLHLIVEAKDRNALTRGMRSLGISLAKSLNSLWGRSGAVLRRYHEHILATPREVRHALRYVLQNAQRHGVRRSGEMDPLSTSAWFQQRRKTKTPSPGAVPKTWLLRIGWKRHSPSLLLA